MNDSPRPQTEQERNDHIERHKRDDSHVDFLHHRRDGKIRQTENPNDDEADQYEDQNNDSDVDQPEQDSG
jgi:hypothetical protein